MGFGEGVGIRNCNSKVLMLNRILGITFAAHSQIYSGNLWGDLYNGSLSQGIRKKSRSPLPGPGERTGGWTPDCLGLSSLLRAAHLLPPQKVLGRTHGAERAGARHEPQALGEAQVLLDHRRDTSQLPAAK